MTVTATAMPTVRSAMVAVDRVGERAARTRRGDQSNGSTWPVKESCRPERVQQQDGQRAQVDEDHPRQRGGQQQPRAAARGRRAASAARRRMASVRAESLLPRCQRSWAENDAPREAGLRGAVGSDCRASVGSAAAQRRPGLDPVVLGPCRSWPVVVRAVLAAACSSTRPSSKYASSVAWIVSQWPGEIVSASSHACVAGRRLAEPDRRLARSPRPTSCSPSTCTCSSDARPRAYIIQVSDQPVEPSSGSDRRRPARFSASRC